jgi:hypothetical protein
MNIAVPSTLPRPPDILLPRSSSKSINIDDPLSLSPQRPAWIDDSPFLFSDDSGMRFRLLFDCAR